MFLFLFTSLIDLRHPPFLRHPPPQSEKKFLLIFFSEKKKTRETAFSHCFYVVNNILEKVEKKIKTPPPLKVKKNFAGDMVEGGGGLKLLRLVYMFDSVGKLCGSNLKSSRIARKPWKKNLIFVKFQMWTGSESIKNRSICGWKARSIPKSSWIVFYLIKPPPQKKKKKKMMILSEIQTIG